MLVTQPDDVHAIWSNESIDNAIISTPPFQNLLTYVQQLPHDYGEGTELSSYLLRVLQNMKLYTQHNIARESVTVVDTLLLLEDIVGEGYYQFEFRRRLQALRNPDK
jgi:hypothetical protein